MHCSNCKAKVNPSDKKCPNCGTMLIWNNKKKQPLKAKNTKDSSGKTDFYFISFSSWRGIFVVFTLFNFCNG